MFDLDTWLQSHIDDLKPSFILYIPKAIIVLNMNTLFIKNDRVVLVMSHKTALSIFDIDL